jgi:hypothetical protein
LRASSQSIAAYTSSVEASNSPRSDPTVVSAHQRVAASFEPGLHTRANTRPTAMSRSRQGGPMSSTSPSLVAIAAAAATCPCGSEREISNPSGPNRAAACAAGTNVSPLSERRISSIVSGGRWDKLPSVSVLTRPPAR